MGNYLGIAVRSAPLFLELLLLFGSDLQEAAPEIPSALGKTSSATPLSWCTTPADQYIP